MIDGITGPVDSPQGTAPYTPSSESVPPDPSNEDTEGFNALMSEEPEDSGTPPATDDTPDPKAPPTEADIIKGIQDQIMTTVMEDSRKNREELQKILDKMAPM